MVAAFEIKLIGLNALKGEIQAEMAKAHKAFNEVRKKIRENVQSDKNKDGLLTGEQEDYLKCLEMDYRKPEYLLRQDERNGQRTLK